MTIINKYRVVLCHLKNTLIYRLAVVDVSTMTVFCSQTQSETGGGVENAWWGAERRETNTLCEMFSHIEISAHQCQRDKKHTQFRSAALVPPNSNRPPRQKHKYKANRS